MSVAAVTLSNVVGERFRTDRLPNKGPEPDKARQKGSTEGLDGKIEVPYGKECER